VEGGKTQPMDVDLIPQIPLSDGDKRIFGPDIMIVEEFSQFGQRTRCWYVQGRRKKLG
jgi:hypothetical protein